MWLMCSLELPNPREGTETKVRLVLAFITLSLDPPNPREGTETDILRL